MDANLVEAKELIEIELSSRLELLHNEFKLNHPNLQGLLTYPWIELLLLLSSLQHSTLITSFVSSTLSIKQPNSHKIIGVLIITEKEVAKLNTYVKATTIFWNPNSGIAQHWKFHSSLISRAIYQSGHWEIFQYTRSHVLVNEKPHTLYNNLEAGKRP